MYKNVYSEHLKHNKQSKSSTVRKWLDKLMTGPCQTRVNELGGFTEIKNDQVLFKGCRVCKSTTQVGNTQCSDGERKGDSSQ